MDLTQVGEYIFAPDNLLDADVAIVLGMSDWRRPVTRAVELYQGGPRRRASVHWRLQFEDRSHGSPRNGRACAGSGVPEADILVEPRAGHTDQNMRFSRELLEASIGLAEFRSILLVTIHYHIRRAIIAARRHFPSSIEIGWVCYPSQALFIVELALFPSWAGTRQVGDQQDRKILRRLGARKRGLGGMTLAIAYGESVEAAPYASLRDAIIGATARIPDGRFIHAKANAPHRTSTYRETLEMAAGLAAGLRERGMRPGDGLIINLRNSEDFIPALWASALAGFVAVPLGSRHWAALRRTGPRRGSCVRSRGPEEGDAHHRRFAPFRKR